MTEQTPQDLQDERYRTAWTDAVMALRAYQHARTLPNPDPIMLDRTEHAAWGAVSALRLRLPGAGELELPSDHSKFLSVATEEVVGFWNDLVKMLDELKPLPAAANTERTWKAFWELVEVLAASLDISNTTSFATLEIRQTQALAALSRAVPGEILISAKTWMERALAYIQYSDELGFPHHFAI